MKRKTKAFAGEYKAYLLHTCTYIINCWESKFTVIIIMNFNLKPQTYNTMSKITVMCTQTHNHWIAAAAAAATTTRDRKRERKRGRESDIKCKSQREK